MPSQDDRKRSRIGVQAYRAVKRVCQYINIHQLKQGQRLPTHQEFASMLGFSNDTLMTAMRELTASGALARRTGVGTILAMPEALPRLLADPDPERAQRALQAMLKMRKIDVAALEAAADGRAA